MTYWMNWKQEIANNKWKITKIVYKEKVIFAFNFSFKTEIAIRGAFIGNHWFFIESTNSHILNKWWTDIQLLILKHSIIIKVLSKYQVLPLEKNHKKIFLWVLNWGKKLWPPSRKNSASCIFTYWKKSLSLRDKIL